MIRTYCIYPIIAQEVKVILDISDKLQKQKLFTNALEAEKEDLVAKLQNAESVRSFLVDKIKSAELTMKSMIEEINGLKQQSASDSEIISYLDLQIQDSESKIVELTHQTKHLQASLDVQIGINSQKVKQVCLPLNLFCVIWYTYFNERLCC